MPRGKKSKSRSRRNDYRERFALQLQMPDQKVSTPKVMISGYDRFIVAAQTAVNAASILRIPANYMDFPTSVSGTWTSQAGAGQELRPVGFERFAGMYNHYHVLGSFIHVTAINSGNNAGGQQSHNIIACTRSDSTGQFSASSSVIDIEQAFATKTARWGGVSPGSSKGSFIKMGYNPHKQFGVVDTLDNSNLRVATSSNLGTSPNERTFYEVALKGLLDTLADGHPEAIVDIKVSYILQYSEPQTDDTPVTSNQPTILTVL